MELNNQSQDKVPVSQEVLDGINAVKNTGVTNMFDTKVVMHILKVIGMDDAAAWIRDNKDQYAQGILYGFLGEKEA